MHTRSVTGAVAAAVALIALHTTGAQGAVVELVLKPCEPGALQQDGGAKLNVVDGNATFTSERGQTVDVNARELLTVDCNGNAIKTNQNGTILSFATTGSTTTASTGAGGGGGGTVGALGQSGGSNGGGGAPGNTATANNGGGNLTGGGAGGGGGGGLSNPTSP